jgi:hypothetical protein
MGSLTCDNSIGFHGLLRIFFFLLFFSASLRVVLNVKGLMFQNAKMYACMFSSVYFSETDLGY